MAETRYPGVRKKGATYSYRFKIRINGKIVTKEKSGFETPFQAHQARQIAYAQCKIDNFIDLNVSLNTVYEKFIEVDATSTRAYTTILRYDSLFRTHIGPEFGNCKIAEINAMQIQTFLSRILDRYQSQYAQSFYNFLKVIFSFAYKKGYVKEDIMNRVDRPADLGNKGVKLLTNEQFKALQERLESTNVQVAFNIGLGLGVRASECYALRWSDFDFENNEVKISKQLQYRNKVWCFAPLKTVNAYRTIKFGPAFAEYLKSIKLIQEQNKLRLKGFYNTNKVIDATTRTETVLEISDFVNVRENGEMLTPNSNKVITRIAKDMGLEFNYHMLRHKYCTTLAMNKVSPTMIKENAGHSRAELTYSVYIHPTESEKIQAAEFIDNEISFKAIAL